MAPTPQDLLAPYLEGSARPNGDIDSHCPLHNDQRRSAVINFEEGVWFCNTEGIGGTLDDLISQRSDWVEPPSSNGSTKIKRSNASPGTLPSEATVEGWKRALQADPILLEDLKVARGLWTKTLDYYEVGWCRSSGAYTIPVRDSAGKLLNIRYYQLRPPADRRKIWGIKGHNKPVLYPWSALHKAKEYVIICGGELDAMVTNQYNFRTVTRTAAERVWHPVWSKQFKGKLVYLCHDCDHAGQAANRKVARALAGIASEVRIIRLPYPITAKHGKDLTDWWLDHDADRGAFQRLLDEAIPWDESMAADPEEIDPGAASVVDAFDSRRAGKPLALTLTVKGRQEPGYTVPRKVKYDCSMDKGPICEICPMKGEGGEMEKVIAGSDPAILEMVGSTRPQLIKLLQLMASIPKCEKLNINVSEHQAVEVLYGRPSVDHSGGEDTQDNSDYKNIKLMSVGRHDTSPNQTVRIVGALHPDPRRQSNEFLAWDLTKQETSLDRFEMDSRVQGLLKQFRPDPGQLPLAKLRDIAEDLSAHATQIYGRPELHAAMDLVFHSAISFDFDGKRMIRGWLELLVVGDTRTGKSEVATRLTRHYSAGEVVGCESATYAGIIGGLQQFGANKEWAITWGVIPMMDRRLVVLDEISGLSMESIGAMSSARSSGVAELQKIQQERTHARTRLIWLGNPRDGRMSDFTYGVQAIRPLIGNPEDIARFDLAMSVSSGDVKSSDINRSREVGAQQYSREAASLLLRWAWSRSPDQIVWGDGATAAVYKAADALGARYVEEPPLIQAANAREKVARVAVALAARLFSSDERGEKVVVERAHVRSAVSFIDRLYNMAGFGYAERSREVIEDRAAAERPDNINHARAILGRNPGLDKFLRSQGTFRRQDLEEILDVDREAANAVISELYALRMIWKDKAQVKLTPTLHRLLREGK